MKQARALCGAKNSRAQCGKIALIAWNYVASTLVTDSRHPADHNLMKNVNSEMASEHRHNIKH